MKRSTHHLIPIEVLCTEEVQSDVPPTVVSDTPLVNHSEEMAEGASEALPLSVHSRPCKQAAVRGEQIRRNWTGH